MFAGAYTAKERVQWPIRKKESKKKKKIREKTRKEKENCNSLRGLFVSKSSLLTLKGEQL